MSSASHPATPMRRNVAVLATTQVLFQCTQIMSIATTPLAGLAMLGADTPYATVPVFLTHLGLMTVTLPAALLMGRVGRRAGFSLGALLGVAGGLTSFLAIWQQVFALLCFGAVLQGASAAFAWHYRFAAADVASPAYRAKAISLVMAGGVFAAFLGPQVAKWSVGLFNPVLFAGVYLVLSAFAVGMLLLVQLVEIPHVATAHGGRGGRPMREIARQPQFLAAVLSSMFGYAVMTLVMSATPLAMNACGFGFGDSATVIQWHAAAMFVPAFFTGSLIARFGVLRIIAVGAVLEIGCALINIAGIDFMNFLFANILVGAGWNFCYVGGSTLLTSTYTTEEKAKVQGTHDFLVYTMTATAAALSGTLQAKSGWAMVNLAALPMLSVVLAVVLWLSWKQKQQPATQAAE